MAHTEIIGYRQTNSPAGRINSCTSPASVIKLVDHVRIWGGGGDPGLAAVLSWRVVVGRSGDTMGVVNNEK